MSQLNDKIYFSNAEIVEILKHYSDEHRKGKVEKIDYKVWRKLKSSEYGVIVKLQSFLKRDLIFYESPISHLTRTPAPSALGNYIAHFDIFDSNFGSFFYDKYYRNHSDYCQTEEEENMATISSINNCNTVTIDSLNGCNTVTIDSLNGYDYANNQTVGNYDHYDYGYWTGTVANSTEEIATKEYVNNYVDKKLNEKKENTNMKGFNFDFGPCTNNNIRMSMYGIAVKNMNDEWVSYNPQTEQIINVDIFNFDGRKYMFKMPVALKDVAVGDVIIHQKKAMFVIAVEDKGLVVVDVMDGEEKKVIPTSNMFGFDFVTKIVSMFSAFAAAPTPDAPFGNFLPFMLMGDDNKDIDPMMLMMMMNNGGDVFSNPMMMYFLAKDGDKDSMLPLMFMMNQNKGAGKPNGK